MLLRPPPQTRRYVEKQIHGFRISCSWREMGMAFRNRRRPTSTNGWTRRASCTSTPTRPTSATPRTPHLKAHSRLTSTMALTTTSGTPSNPAGAAPMAAEAGVHAPPGTKVVCHPAYASSPVASDPYQQSPYGYVFGSNPKDSSYEVWCPLAEGARQAGQDAYFDLRSYYEDNLSGQVGGKAWFGGKGWNPAGRTCWKAAMQLHLRRWFGRWRWAQLRPHNDGVAYASNVGKIANALPSTFEGGLITTNVL